MSPHETLFLEATPICDINNTLSILRQNKIGAEKKAIERNSKAANEFVKKLFADLAGLHVPVDQ